MVLVSRIHYSRGIPRPRERSGADRPYSLNYPSPNIKSRSARPWSAPDSGKPCGPGNWGTRPGGRSDGSHARSLLDLDGRTGVFKLLLDLRGLVLVDPFLDRLGRAFDQVLSLLEAETSDRAHLLDHVDLLFARCRQDDGELGLLRCGFRGWSSAATSGCGNSHRGRRRNAPLLLKQLRELRRLEDGQARQLVYQLRKISHCSTSGME